MKNRKILRLEHETLRNGVGFYSFFVLQYVEVTGKDAQEFLDYIYVNNVAKMKKGKALYTSMLDEEGTMLDDVIVLCRETDKFWIVTEFSDELQDWIDYKRGNKDVYYRDITHEIALYAIQGPKSTDVVNDLVKDNVDDLKRFTFKDTKIDDMEIMVSSTGFTGETGYEIYFDPRYTDEDKLAKAIKEKGAPYEIEQIFSNEVILGSIRTEKGLMIADDFSGLNPIEAGLGWTVNCDKDFIGKKRTCLDKKEGPKRNRLGFTVEDDDAKVEKDNIVKLNGKDVGKVTNYTYGFTIEKYIGYAVVDSEAKKGDKVTITTDNGEVEATLQDSVFM